MFRTYSALQDPLWDLAVEEKKKTNNVTDGSGSLFASVKTLVETRLRPWLQAIRSCWVRQ